MMYGVARYPDPSGMESCLRDLVSVFLKYVRRDKIFSRIAIAMGAI